jgi:hypothetical protein
MSIRIMSAVWERDDLTSTQKLVLLALADWANDEGLCWPSIEQLIKKSSLKKRAVQITIRSLEESGFVYREERIGKGNRYWIKIPVHNMHPCTKDAPPVHEMRPTHAPDAPNTSKTHQLTTNSNIPAKPEGVSDEVWKDFIDLRKAKRAPLNATALKAIERETAKAGWTLNDAIAESVARGWQSFKAEWVKEKSKANGKTDSMGRTERAALQALRDLGITPHSTPGTQSEGDGMSTPRGNGIAGNQSSPLLTFGDD